MLEQLLLRIGTLISLHSMTAPPSEQETFIRMENEAKQHFSELQKRAEENFKKREEEARKRWNSLRYEIFRDQGIVILHPLPERAPISQIPIPESEFRPVIPRFPKREIIIVPAPILEIPEEDIFEPVYDPEDPRSPEYYKRDHPRKREIPKIVEKPKHIKKADPIPEGSRLETLIEKAKLSGTEFQELISLVPNIKTYEAIRNRRYLYYPADGYIYEVKGKSYTDKSAPKKERKEFNSDGNLYYGSPLRTHNLRHGVCDELAVHFAAFFSGKTGYKIFLFSYEPKVGDGHAVTVYQGPSGKWGYQSNFKVTDEIYYSKDQALQASISNEVKFKANKIFVRELLPGKWMTTTDRGSHLRPVKRYKLQKEY